MNDKNMNKISYALGLGIGQQLKSMGISDFNVQDFTKSICDVLSDGELAGAGTHDKLFESCRTYREIYLSQQHEKEAQK